MSSSWISFGELSALVGARDARALCSAVGGVRIYIPKRPVPGHRLSGIVGAQALMKLCGHYGGMDVTFPNMRKNAPVKARAMAMLERGASSREVALSLGVTERYVSSLAGLVRGDWLTLLPSPEKDRGE